MAKARAPVEPLGGRPGARGLHDALSLPKSCGTLGRLPGSLVGPGLGLLLGLVSFLFFVGFLFVCLGFFGRLGGTSIRIWELSLMGLEVLVRWW